MLSNSFPGSPEIPKVPKGITILSDGSIEFDGQKSPSLTTCYDLKNQKTWNQHETLIRSWINHATDEDVFKYLRGDFSKCFSSNISLSPEKTEELKKSVLTFIWLKNPELQEKYPNFEGITTFTEAQKIGYEPKTNKPWISLSFMPNNHKGHLSIFTRSTQTDEFTEHFYLIHKDGSAEFRVSKTQSELEIALKNQEVNNRVLNTLIQEANGDHLKIAQVFLADAKIKTIQSNAKKGGE